MSILSRLATRKYAMNKAANSYVDDIMAGKNVGIPESTRKYAVGAAVTGAAMSGFSSGVSQSGGDLSGGIYELATGDPNIDQYVFGTDVGLRELMLPITGPNLMGNQVDELWNKKRFINPTMIGRMGSAERSGYYENKMPAVNGSLVFGQYNSRGG